MEETLANSFYEARIALIENQIRINKTNIDAKTYEEIKSSNI